MKSLYILGIVVLLGLALFVSKDVKVNTKYAQWKHQYGMVFNDEEDQYREQVFNENLKEIENHNDPSYTVGINKFTGLTKEEFRSTYLKTVVGERSGRTYKRTYAAPADIDWRTSGSVSPVKDQGQCGSCWAFSTTGNLESVNFIYGKQPMTLFSEQQLVDCSIDYGNLGCNGGLQDRAFKYVEANGITTESAYPYTAKTGLCKEKTGSFKITKYTDIPENNCNALIEALAIEPISITVDASNWSPYTGGVFTNCAENLDHAVLLVGFNQEGGYYIVKNSWGAAWGEQGYIRLGLYDGKKEFTNTCGICQQNSYSSL